MRQALALVLLAATTAVASPAQPYEEGADAHAAIATAIREAGRARQEVLVVFGANWCPDCRLLDASLKSGATASLMSERFRIVKVDVGRFDRNVDIAKAYGVPLEKGIPAVAVLSGAGKVLYATQAGELADARKMGDAGIHDFFAGMVRRPGLGP